MKWNPKILNALLNDLDFEHERIVQALIEGPPKPGEIQVTMQSAAGYAVGQKIDIENTEDATITKITKLEHSVMLTISVLLKPSHGLPSSIVISDV